MHLLSPDGRVVLRSNDLQAASESSAPMPVPLMDHDRAGPHAPVAGPIAPAPMWGVLIPAFLKALRDGGATPTVLSTYMFTLRLLIERIGDKPVAHLSAADADDFLDMLAHYPPRSAQRAEYRELTVAEVLLKARHLGDPPMHASTRQKHIERTRAFLAWLADHHGGEPALLNHVRVHFPARAQRRRARALTAEEWTRVFNPAEGCRHRTPYQYWVPLLMAFNGMRLQEAAQLYVDDINFDGQGPWLEVCNDRPGQRIHAAHSRRRLYIHPQLLELGFSDFVAQARRCGRQSLFPDLNWGRRRPGEIVGTWFAALRRRIRLHDPRIHVESLRLSFVEWARHQELHELRLTRWLGLADDKHLTLRWFYLAPNKPALSLDELRAIPMPTLAIAPYDPDQFETAFAMACERERAAPPPSAAYRYLP